MVTLTDKQWVVISPLLPKQTFTKGGRPRADDKITLEGILWILKGKDKLIKSNTGRDRVNLNGALNAKTLEVVIREDDMINSTSTINLLDALLDKHPAGRIYLIWDNARYYYSRQVQHYLRGHPRLIPKFLPPYSPNLNLIERLWRLFHQKVTYNQYYETFPKFKESCLNFFENIHLYQKEMKTLLTDSFQLIPTQKLQIGVS